MTPNPDPKPHNPTDESICRNCNQRMSLILTLGAALGCHDGETTPEERIRELTEEPGRWQAAIYVLLCGTLPHARIDGKGCDSGDPLDVTLAEITQAMNYLLDRGYDVAAERDRLLEERQSTNLALSELQRELDEERERNRQMVDGKVADDKQHERALALISARQAKELSELRGQLAEMEASRERWRKLYEQTLEGAE